MYVLEVHPRVTGDEEVLGAAAMGKRRNAAVAATMLGQHFVIDG